MELNTQPPQYPLYADLPPLIPESVEHIQIPPTVSITPAPSSVPKAVRPNQLDLDGPVRPARHLKPPNVNNEMPVRRNLSPIMTSEWFLKNIGFGLEKWSGPLLFTVLTNFHFSCM